MLFTILCTFRPGGQAEAKQRRLEHYQFLRKVKGSIVEGGPLLGPDGFPTNMLIVVDCENEDAAKSFIAEEPYTNNGLFESVSIRRWSHVIPEPSENFIESEYKKELALRGK
ncbi:MAG: YciI family protein [Verrucomicrobia bacterium]|nr:YciI family protein [Verrucomicrobiota bacterium]